MRLDISILQARVTDQTLTRYSEGSGIPKFKLGNLFGEMDPAVKQCRGTQGSARVCFAGS